MKTKSVTIPRVTANFKTERKAFKEQHKNVDDVWKSILNLPHLVGIYSPKFTLTPGTKGAAWQITYWTKGEPTADTQLTRLEDVFSELRHHKGLTVTVFTDKAK